VCNRDDFTIVRYKNRSPFKVFGFRPAKPSVRNSLSNCGPRNSDCAQGATDGGVNIRKIDEPFNLMSADAALLHPVGGTLGVVMLLH
jgi:hypothetical protein